MNSFTKAEISLLKKINTPAKVQDYLNTLRFNFETDGIDTLKSPFRVIREGNAHCIEGAVCGAYMLAQHGYKPLILHLKAIKGDFDHVIALFQEDGYWGALSKTNHAVLRYREPVYKTVRELVMSYFHEYFLNSNGKKTLRAYSVPLNLNIFEKGWETEEGDLFGIDEELDHIKHYDIAPKSILKKLRPAEEIERKAGSVVESTAPKKK
jgi:hypothetical protein